MDGARRAARGCDEKLLRHDFIGKRCWSAHGQRQEDVTEGLQCSFGGVAGRGTAGCRGCDKKSIVQGLTVKKSWPGHGRKRKGVTRVVCNLLIWRMSPGQPFQSPIKACLRKCISFVIITIFFYRQYTFRLMSCRTTGQPFLASCRQRWSTRHLTHTGSSAEQSGWSEA